ncbi:LOW QUALITY PROTEIN: uncharacterized protein ftr63 [Aulostomus maculatus]
MAQRGVHLNGETLSCLICLGLLNDRTIPYRHNYYNLCVAARNTWPHFKPLATQKPKLVEPSKKLENSCSHYEEEMKVFYCTDQQCIRYRCSVDEHKGHNIFSAAAEKTERQKELEGESTCDPAETLEHKKDLKVLQQQVKNINTSADAVEHSEKVFTEQTCLMERRSSHVEQQIRSIQETSRREISHVKGLQEKLEQEITELKRKNDELKQLSLTDHHSQFQQSYPSMSQLRKCRDSSSISVRPQHYFDSVTAVSQTRDKLQDILRETGARVSLMVTQVDVLL